MGKNAAYAAQYAEEAKEQMRMYGIPASVILAQAILESSNGQSQLSRECNNHFGIKATASWLKNGGEYGVYTDDRPNEKFCKYKSVGDSYEHHSQFLKQNKRYAQCFTLSPDDYKGWTKGIERAGYATGGGYAASLQRIIEANGLDKYDSEVMAEMRAEGRSFGVENNPRREMPAAHVPQSAGYSFPVEREEFLFITSPFGNRQDPMDATKQQMHKGIDIKTNHEAVLATENGGKVVAVYTDDRPNEKFCKYKSVGDSYEHHSQFLKQNKRYAQCFTLSPDDYKGWTKGIERAGYATGGGYAASLQRIIEANGLDKYDSEVMAEMRAEGRSFGVENNPRREMPAAHVPQSAGYSFPVEREEFLFITSPFGNRQDPMDATKQQMHKGIDIKTNHEAVLATENGGKVVAVNHNANTAGGKSVTVEYSREDGSKVQCSYLHLSDIAVKVGDVVNASQKLGVSGNTGTRTTGEHLHFGVKSVSADGSKRDMDPAAYLAEIGQKGNIKLQALHNGNDLLAKYKSNAPQEQKVSSEDWMKKILSSEDSGVGISGTNDPILDMAMTTFMSLMMLAAQIDSNDEERQKGLISAMAANRLVDLTSLVPGMRQCTITVGENGKTVLHAESGTVKIDRELTSSEMNRLSLILGNANLSEESKRTKIAGMVTGIVATQQASQNFEQGMEAESQQQNLQRK